MLLKLFEQFKVDDLLNLFQKVQKMLEIFKKLDDDLDFAKDERDVYRHAMNKLYDKLDRYERFDLDYELEKLPVKRKRSRTDSKCKDGERDRKASESGIENESVTKDQQYDSWQDYLNR